MLRYADGEIIKDGDICTTSKHKTFARLFYVRTDGTVFQYKTLLNTKFTQTKDKDSVTLKSGKGKKFDNFELLIRQEEWEKILEKLANKADKLCLDLDYEIPEKMLKKWTVNETSK